jgi:hypothetical protein
MEYYRFLIYARGLMINLFEAMDINKEDKENQTQEDFNYDFAKPYLQQLIPLCSMYRDHFGEVDHLNDISLLSVMLLVPMDKSTYKESKESDLYSSMSNFDKYQALKQNMMKLILQIPFDTFIKLASYSYSAINAMLELYEASLQEQKDTQTLKSLKGFRDDFCEKLADPDLIFEAFQD